MSPSPQTDVSALVEPLLAAGLVLGSSVIVGVLLVTWLAAAGIIRLEAPRAPVRRRRAASGPVRVDGRWVRVVEDDQGDRIVESLEGADVRRGVHDMSRPGVDPSRPR